MAQYDVIQIKVGNNTVGIIDLKKTISEIALECTGKSDDEIGHELVNRLSKRNYIPENRKEAYSKAFLKEFKKSLGLPFEEDPIEGLEIKVLGQGCVQCNKLEQDVMSVLAELNIMADVQHITDIKEIGGYGVMGAPALVINGKVKSVGRIPSRNELAAWLKEEKVYDQR